MTGSDPSLPERTLSDLQSTEPSPRPRPGGSTTTKQVRPRAPRGLLDFLLAAILLYGVYAKTPAGALMEWGFRAWVLDQEHSPSFFATFRGRDSEVELKLEHLQKGVLASLSFPSAIEEASKRSGIDRELLAVLVAGQGRCEEDACWVNTPPHLGALLERVIEDDEVPLLFVALGLAKAAQRFSAGPEVAVEALFIPPHAVERAIGQARASGLSNPEDIESHASFYAPSLRRGALQDAVRVLALHRLRTLAWPTPDSARTTSPYGFRVHPITKRRRFHNGTDIAVGTGTPLKSAHRGRVGRTGQDSISGKYVHLRHGFGIVSTDCHMSEVHVRQGDPLERGQVVGLSGATGRVTGPHLHYIVRIEGKTVDPEAYGFAPARRLATDDAALPQAGLAPVTPAKKVSAKKPRRKTSAKKKKEVRRQPVPAAKETGKKPTEKPSENGKREEPANDSPAVDKASPASSKPQAGANKAAPKATGIRRPDAGADAPKRDPKPKTKPPTEGANTPASNGKSDGDDAAADSTNDSPGSNVSSPESKRSEEPSVSPASPKSAEGHDLGPAAPSEPGNSNPLEPPPG